MWVVWVHSSPLPSSTLDSVPRPLGEHEHGPFAAKKNNLEARGQKSRIDAKRAMQLPLEREGNGQPDRRTAGESDDGRECCWVGLKPSH